MSRIRDLERDRPGREDSADVCIVGAGAAGIVLAVELLRLGKRVTLLEAGGLEIEPRSQDPYRSEVTGLPHKGIHSGRFRTHGGTTTRWGGQILELDAQDFLRREAVPGSGWPFGKEELTPSYARALELEGLGAALQEDPEVWAKLNLPVPTFQGIEPYFSRWCPEPNFARLHAATLEHHSALTVWLHANAVELQLEDGAAKGIRCRTLDGTEMIFSAAQYVFCLGTIESSRFFLQPRSGPLPWNDSGLLGRHFQDHLDASAAEVVPKEGKQFHALFDNVFLNGHKYHPKLRLATAEQRRLGTLTVASTMVFSSRSEIALASGKATFKHLLRGRLQDLTAKELATALVHLPLLVRQGMRYGLAHRAYNPPGSRIQLRVHCEQEPLGASCITLSDQRDSLGLLRTRMDWRIADAELASIRAMVEVAQDALRSVASVLPDADLLLSPRAFAARCDDSNHHMGGMRMAVSPAEGVVNPDLKLHGTRNVYVCSAAVFPTGGYSNPTHTLLALAVRLARHLG